jgi:hypothetical protein
MVVKVSQMSDEALNLIHLIHCAPHQSSSSIIEAFHRIMLLNDNGDSTKHFTVSFRNTAGFFPVPE